MSEPLTSHEIENVLTSIRRLVSTELRPSLKPPANAEAVDKLLLTPSLRVVEGGGATRRATSHGAPVPVATGLAGIVHEVVAETMAATIAGTVAEVFPGKPAAAPSVLSLGDGAEGGVSAMPDPEEIEVFFGEAAPLGRAQVTEDYDDAHLGDEGWSYRAASERTAAAMVSPADDVLRGDAPGHAAEHSDIVAVAEIPEVDWVQSGDAWGDESGSIQEETAPLAAAEPAPQAGAAEASTADQAFIARPRAGGFVADEPLARAWADRAEAEITAELQKADTQKPHTQPQTAPEAALFDADEHWPDEEILREVVRRMLREELAGVLGERITRNIRKLVRLEVNRALTTRDFE